MYTGLLFLHSILRYVLLILLVIAIVKHYNGMKKNTAYTAGERKLDLFLMISAHTTLLIGIYQWFAGPWGLKNIQNRGFGEVMKSSTERFFAVEHLVGMIVAIALITVARGTGKPTTAGGKEHKKAFTLMLIALVLILILVPWPFRANLGRGWVVN